MGENENHPLSIFRMEKDKNDKQNINITAMSNEYPIEMEKTDPEKDISASSLEKKMKSQTLIDARTHTFNRTR